MPETERVERTRIKANFAFLFKREGARNELMDAYIAVNMVQYGRITVKIKRLFPFFGQENKNFLI